jgi:RNA polymerase sigma factor (sigma-70 family)
MERRTSPRPIASGAAFEQTRRAMLLLSEHEPAFRRTARRYSLCAEDAEDAFQRAVEILLTKAPEGPGSLVGWMQVVTRREALAVARLRRRRFERSARFRQPASAPGPIDADHLPAQTFGPQVAVEARERVAEAAAGLAALKPQERRALALQGAGCSYAEIQAITGWTYTKVNRCLAEGRAALRRLGPLPDVA